MSIMHINIIGAGETPWDYRRNPSTLSATDVEGGWGETPAEAIAELRAQAGIQGQIVDQWHRGEGLWLAVQSDENHAANGGE